jgi:hypothetical protein
MSYKKFQFYYMHYVEYSNTNILTKYLGIHLNTLELKWARPDVEYLPTYMTISGENVTYVRDARTTFRQSVIAKQLSKLGNS